MEFENFKTIKEIKSLYDSKLYSVILDDRVLIIDHQGRMFIYSQFHPEDRFLPAGNTF